MNPSTNQQHDPKGNSMEDFQFYPTPLTLAVRAWEKFRNREFIRVLEPSAGMGNLAEQHPDYRDRYRRARAPIDCCEIDVTRHPVLQGKSFNVIGVDFLQLESAAMYSHIIMNPPFASGATHVLKAWDILWDGEIVAIINAETLKNPYAFERGRLLSLVEQHGEVEFIENAFSVPEAERKTDVTVALIYLRKHADMAGILDNLLDHVKRDSENGSGLSSEYHESNEVALPNSFIENCVLDFKAATRAMQEAVYAEARSNHYTERLGSTMAATINKRDDASSQHTAEWVQTETGKRYDLLKDRAWSRILTSADVTSRLSSKAQQSLLSEFCNIKKLEFSAANIYGFLCGLIESKGRIQIEMLCDLFDEITKYHSDNVVFYKGWKSNDAHRCGYRIRPKRFILPRNQMDKYSSSLPWESMCRLADFDKAFALLDGKERAEVSLVDLFRTRLRDLRDGQRVSCAYFDIRFYPGIGTIHFFPRSAKLIESLNLAVGRHRRWLPPEGAKAPEAFWLQYRDAEKFDKEVRAAFYKAKAPCWGDNLDTVTAGKGENEAGERLNAAIDKVLRSHGVDTNFLLDDEGQQGAFCQLPLLDAAVRWHTQEPALSPAQLGRESGQGGHPACG
jgi:hypothetical protein